MTELLIVGAGAVVYIIGYIVGRNVGLAKGRKRGLVEAMLKRVSE